MGKNTRNLVLGAGILAGAAIGVDQLYSQSSGGRSNLSKLLQKVGLYSNVEEKLKRLNAEARKKWRAGQIKEPEVAAFIRTYGVDSEKKVPQGEMPMEQAIKRKEKTTFFMTLSIPKGQSKVPITVEWEKNGEPFDEKDYETKASPAFRLWFSKTFYKPGKYRLIMRAGEKIIQDREFDVVDDGRPYNKEETFGDKMREKVYDVLN